MLQDGCLGVVDKHFGWDTAKKLEGVLMGLEEVFGSLAQAELDVNQAAVAKHHDKERQSPPGRADVHRTGTTPIDLSAFALSKGQRQESRRTNPADGAHVIGEDGDPTGVAFLGPEALEDLRGSVGMPFQPALDEFLVGIELTFPRCFSPHYRVTFCPSPLGYRLFIKMEFPSDLSEV